MNLLKIKLASSKRNINALDFLRRPMKSADTISAQRHRADQAGKLAVRAIQHGMCASLLLASFAAQAVLGEGVASIYQAQQSLASTLKAEPGAQYSVYTHTLSNGTVVREYLSQQDLVFALVWQGPAWPDYALMLGRFYDRFVTLSKQRRAESRSSTVVC